MCLTAVLRVDDPEVEDERGYNTLPFLWVVGLGAFCLFFILYFCECIVWRL